MSEPSLLQKVFMVQAQLLEGTKVDEKQLSLILRDAKQLPMDQLKMIDSMLTAQQGITDNLSLKQHAKMKRHFRKLCDAPGSAKMEYESEDESQLMLQCNILQFISHFEQQNSRKIGLCLLDEFGSFVFYDELTREMFELNHERMKAQNIFSMMFPASLKRLKDRYHGNIMGFSANSKNRVAFSVYSESNRKRTLKKMAIVKRQYMEQTPSARRRASNQMVVSKDSDEIYCKYLKCLQMNFQRVQVVLSKNSFQSLADVNIHINMNHQQLSAPNSEQIIFQAVLGEVRESESFEQFNFYELAQDPKIQRFEEKFTRKLQKLSQQVKRE